MVQFSGADIPYLRADWFIVTATQRPLYHQLLDIPETLTEVEHELQLDIHRNFLNGDVVFDRAAVLGTPAIINGVSCMVCHCHGMIQDFRDELRDADSVADPAREHVRKVYPPHEEISV